MERHVRGKVVDLAIILVSACAFACLGWRWNMALAGIVAPTLLIRFTRDRQHWYGAFLPYPLLVLGTLLSMWKAWDLSPAMMIVLPCIRPILFFPPLFLDRWARKRLGSFAATFVFPASMVAVDYAMSFTPLATTLSGAVGLFGLRELSQVASLGGIWALGFVAWWLASALNAFFESGCDLRAAGAAAIVPLSVLAAALAFGSIRVATDPMGAPTVRVAGVTVAHPRDYWNLIDAKTPRDATLAIVPETQKIEEGLFEASARAAAAGAKLVVWSEGACVMNQDQEAVFIRRAESFAREKRIYLAAAVLVLRFGSGISDNKVLMFTPEGRQAYSYVKTISWYPTDSDGVLKVVDTPYGRVGTAICFDMDTPKFARGLAALGADIVLVPAYDSAKIRPFHTEVGLFRAVENGYSILRQVAEGTSIAVDGRGIVRGMQDYYADSDRLFIVDLPVKATASVYSKIGDAFAWIDLAILAVLGIGMARRKKRS